MNSPVPTKTELIDTFWRCVHTWIQGFTGTMISFPILSTFNVAGLGEVDWTPISLAVVAASVGSVAGVLSVIKTYSSNKLGTGTATERTEAAVGLQPVASNSATPAN